MEMVRFLVDIKVILHRNTDCVMVFGASKERKHEQQYVHGKPQDKQDSIK